MTITSFSLHKQHILACKNKCCALDETIYINQPKIIGEEAEYHFSFISCSAKLIFIVPMRIRLIGNGNDFAYLYAT